MNFIKSHKQLIILVSIIIVAIILVLILLSSFNIDYNKSEYGNRLNKIEEHKIKNTDKLIKEMEALEETKKCSYRLQGKLIYITLTMVDGVNIDKAKEIANKVLDYFEKDDLKYYDLEVILKNENGKMENYPKIGQKHKTSDAIVW